MQIALTRVSFTYPGAIDPIIKDATLAFACGWTAVLGDNGCGKSTLAKLACGLLQPDAGVVTSNAFTVYCPQEAAAEPAELFDFASSYDKLAIELRKSLGIADDMPWRFNELSFGERKKLQVATALWQRPDAILLDEPSNHLDAQTRAELIPAFARFGGIGVLISHDRQLLSALAQRFVSFEAGGIVVRNGAYDDVVAQQELEATSAQHKRGEAKRELARLAQEKQRRAAQADRADARSSKRGIDPKDHDAKAKIDLARVSGQDGARCKLSAQMDSKLSLAQKRLDETFVQKRYSGNVWIDATPVRRDVLLRMPEATIACGDAGLHVPDIYLGSTDHVGIVGRNGAGKSTLVRHLLHQVPDDIEPVVIPQEVTREDVARALASLSALSAADRGQALSIVAQLNSDPDRLIQTDTTSPGEMRKLMLALGVLRSPKLIVMDEPTNHLDLGSVQALERLLANYPGALVLVSHDNRFLDACTSTVWTVHDGKVDVRM